MLVMKDESRIEMAKQKLKALKDLLVENELVVALANCEANEIISVTEVDRRMDGLLSRSRVLEAVEAYEKGDLMKFADLFEVVFAAQDLPADIQSCRNYIFSQPKAVQLSYVVKLLRVSLDFGNTLNSISAAVLDQVETHRQRVQES